MKRVFAGVLCLFALFAVLSAVPVAAAAKEEKEKIVFGYILDSSKGSTAAEEAAVRLAVDTLNKKGGVKGKKLAVKFVDSKGSLPVIRGFFRENTEWGSVVAFIGPNDSLGFEETGEELEKGGIPRISTMASAWSYEANVYNNSFSMSLTDIDRMDIAAKFILETLKLKNAAVFSEYINNPYVSGLDDNTFVALFEEAGGSSVEADMFDRSEEDIPDKLKKLHGKMQTASADVLVLLCTDEMLPKMLKQARKAGVEQPIVCVSRPAADMREVVGNYLGDNTYWIADVNPDDNKVKYLITGNETLSEAGAYEDFNRAVLAYDAVYWLKDALLRAGSTKPAAIVKALGNTKKLPLLSGSLTMGINHRPVKRKGYVLITEPDSERFQCVASIEPSEKEAESAD